jgi:ribosomal protein S18 acetylase RimI-like enzyme
VRVWRAAPEEAPAVAALLGGFRDHLGYDGPHDRSVLASVERIIGRDDAEYLLGTAAGDEPAGVVQVRYRWSVWWESEDCWLEDLYVREEARGSGLGRALTEAVIERARARGCRRVELDVNSENPPALALYRSLGFETGKTGGQDLLMRLRL